MRMMTLAAAALMCSASAFAQTSPAAPSDAASNAEAPASATSDQSTMPSSDPSMTQDASQASSMNSTTASAAMPSGGSVDIAAYDTNKDGALAPLEFAMAMKGSDTSMSAEAKRERYSRAAGNGAVKLLNETAADFSKADQNQDKRVDSSELAMLHSGGTSASAGASTPMTSGAGSMSAAPSTDTGATMSPSTSSSSTTDPMTDSPTATDEGETDPSNANSSATVPPTDPKN